MSLTALPALMLKVFLLRHPVRRADLKLHRRVPGHNLSHGDDRLSLYQAHAGLVPLGGCQFFLFPINLLARAARPLRHEAYWRMPITPMMVMNFGTTILYWRIMVSQ